MTQTPKPRPEVTGTPIVVRLQPDLLERLDRWRRAQSDPPSRPEAMRRLIEQSLIQRKSRP